MQLAPDFTGQIGKLTFGEIPNALENIAAITVRLVSLSGLDLKDSITDRSNSPFKLSLLNGSDVVFRFKRIYADKLPLHNIKMPPKGRIDFDSFGQLSRSIVEITFSPQQINSTKYAALTNNEERHSFLSEEARCFLGIFIKKYTQVTGQFWVRTISKTELLSYDIETFSTTMIKTKLNVNMTAMIDTREESHYISRDDEHRLIKAMKQPHSSKVMQLLLSAQSFLLYEENELAIVQCALAFEMFIYRNLEIAVKKGITSKTKVNKSKKKDKITDGCNCHVGIQQICENGMKSMLDIDFGSTVEFSEIRDDVIKLRNLIVHGEDITIDNITAQKAINATKKALEYLEIEFDKISLGC